MKHLLLGLASLSLIAACPVRDNTYIAGTVIQPADVLANENALFTGIQNGLETNCIADNAITTNKIATGAVTSLDILDGTITTADLAFSVSNQILPSGAIFFMLTGSCPSWTTDISATYEGYFVRASATAGTSGGANTHTHTGGSFAGPAHTHSITDVVQTRGWNATSALSSYPTAGAVDAAEFQGVVAASGGTGAVTGTSDSSSNLPVFISAKLCRVN